MNFFEFFELLENKQYFQRNLTPRDLNAKLGGGVIRLIAASDHPTFQDPDIDQEKIAKIVQEIMSMLARNHSIVLSTPNDNDNVQALALISVHGTEMAERWLEIPVFMAGSSGAATALLDILLKKHYSDSDENIGKLFKKKMIYVRVHHDPITLNALNRKGFRIESDGEWIVASYPKSNMRHAQRFKWYDDRYSQQGKTDFAGGIDQEDEFGLFDGLPWQDQ